MRAALYARVSTVDKQHPEMQLEDLRAYAQQRGFTVVQEFTDRCSGSKSSRPGLDALMAGAKRREFDVILTWKLDRFGRSLKQLVDDLAELNAVGVTFLSLRDGFDLTTPAGRALAGMLAVLAEFERDLIRERVRAGLAHARRQGRRGGRPRRAWSPRTVARVQDLRDEGKSWQEVSRQTHIAVGTLFAKFGKTL